MSRIVNLEVLPEDFSFIFSFKPSSADSTEILHGYCRTCTKKTSCEMRKNLSSIDFESDPIWEDSFRMVKIQTPYRGFSLAFRTMNRAYCSEYQNPQLFLPGIEKDFSDGVGRLIELVERDKAEYYEIMDRVSSLRG